MIQGILLAAGFSTRFGGNKLLATLPDGRPLVRAAALALGAGVDRLLVVGRADLSSLREALQGVEHVWIDCADARTGMAASLGAGVRASMQADGWVIGLADMPWMNPLVVAQVAAALRSGARLVAPVCGGRRGHPVGVAGEFRQHLLDLQGDTGARQLLQDYADALQLIGTDDSGVLRDVDVPADLRDTHRMP